MMNILSSSNNAKEDRKEFFKTALFNDLIYNTDGHAKNASIFHTRKGFLLTPMYDLLSAHFLKDAHAEYYETLQTCLFINGKRKFSEIGPTDWQKEAKSCGLTREEYEDIVHDLQKSVAHLDIPALDRPLTLDLNQLEPILQGTKQRAKIILN